MWKCHAITLHRYVYASKLNGMSLHRGLYGISAWYSPCVLEKKKKITSYPSPPVLCTMLDTSYNPPPLHRARRLSWTEAKCCWLIVARSDLLSRLALLCDPGNVGSRLAGEASLTRRDCLIHLQEVLYGTYWSRKGNKSQKSCSSTDSLRSGHVATRLRRCSGCRRRGRLGNTMGFSGWWSEKIILLHHC